MYDTILGNQQNNLILHNISLDKSSGIETMVANMNTPSSANIPVLVYTDEPPIEEVILQPRTEVTLIKNNASEKNNLLNKINNLDDNSKLTIIGGLMLVSIVLILISIFR